MHRLIVPSFLGLVVACSGDNFDAEVPVPPTLGDVAVSTAEDTPVTVAVPVTAMAANALTLSVLTEPTHGVLGGDGPTWTYTPAADYVGEDTLVVRGEDEFGSATATVTITVTPVGDAPAANPDSFAGVFDTPLTIAHTALLANDTDIDSEALTVTAVESVADGHGEPALSGSDVVFTPEPGFEGVGAFAYTISDGELTAQGTVTVTIGENRAPTAADDTATTDEDTTLVIPDATLVANDADPDLQTLVISTVGNPTGGTVTHDGSQITFVPDLNFVGEAQFEYTVTDQLLTDVGTVTVTVGPVNDAPEVATSAGTAAYVENTAAVAVDPAVALADGDSTVMAGATVQITSGCASAQDVLALASPPSGIAVTGYEAASCTLTLTGAASLAVYQDALRLVTYENTSDAPTAAVRVVRFAVDDGEAASNIGSATRDVAVTATDDDPVATDDSPTVAEDAGATALSVLGNDTDVDGGAMSIGSVVQPASGTVVIVDGTSLTYSPDANYCNNPPGTTSDVFTYTLQPGGSTGTVSVTVTCGDDAPVAVADTAIVGGDSGANTINVLTNDTDIDGGPMTVASVTQPGNGTAAVGSGGSSVTYAPASGYCNEAPNAPPDTFTYTLVGGSSTTVAVDVTCVCGMTLPTDFVVGSN